ncbi:hypothetical protein BJX61DRAFT_449165 [Aspergillus egyptiacus]|nr:hypothetical protein BJX61DRAFT_449165 [Aspergillus egyptiacus]
MEKNISQHFNQNTVTEEEWNSITCPVAVFSSDGVLALSTRAAVRPTRRADKRCATKSGRSTQLSVKQKQRLTSREILLFLYSIIGPLKASNPSSFLFIYPSSLCKSYPYPFL